MEEIKFRVWNGRGYKNEYCYFQFHINQWDTKDQFLFHEVITGKDCIIEQYTGLKDSKGFEIFEGDIVSVPYIDPIGKIHHDTESHKSEVSYSLGRFTLLEFPEPKPITDACVQSTGEYFSNYGNIIIIKKETILTVVGNVHENSELLK